MRNIVIAEELQPPFTLDPRENWYFSLVSRKHYRITDARIYEYGADAKLLHELRSPFLPDPKRSSIYPCYDGSYLLIRGYWTERSVIYSIVHHTSISLPHQNCIVVGDNVVIQASEKAKEAQIYDLRTGELLYRVNVGFPICYIHKNYLVSAGGIYEVFKTGKKRTTQMRISWRSKANCGARYGWFAYLPEQGRREEGEATYYTYVCLETLKVTQGPKYDPLVQREEEWISEEDDGSSDEEDQLYTTIPMEGIHLIAKQDAKELLIRVYSMRTGRLLQQWKLPLGYRYAPVRRDGTRPRYDEDDFIRTERFEFAIHGDTLLVEDMKRNRKFLCVKSSDE